MYKHYIMYKSWLPPAKEMYQLIYTVIVIDQVDLKTTYEEADIMLNQQVMDTVHECHRGVAVPTSDWHGSRMS